MHHHLNRIWPLLGLLFCTAGLSRAETAVESSAETRFQIDFQVPEAALKAYLPAGWTSAPATTGPAKDCNLRVIFVDRYSVHAPDGQPVGKTGSNRLVYLAAPVKDPSGATVQLMIGGLTEDPADVPGPFGVYLAATTHTLHRDIATVGADIIESQDWVFHAATGEHLEFHIKFVRGPGGKRAPADVKFYSAKNPAFYQISRQEMSLDILRNTTTTPPDHVKEYSFKGGSGSYAKLFDGTEKVLSWDNIIWLNRTVLLP